jgi:hypothetical protein
MRARTLLTTSLALALALAGCGGPVLFADLKMPSVEVTLPQYPFPGSKGETTVFKDISFDVGANVPVVNEPNVDLELRLTHLAILLRSTDPRDVNGFDGVKSVRISALDPATGTPALLLASYDRPDGATAITQIAVASATSADLRPFLSAGVITVRAEYTSDSPPIVSLGALPFYDWTADVTAEFAIDVKVDYGAYL